MHHTYLWREWTKRDCKFSHHFAKLKTTLIYGSYPCNGIRYSHTYIRLTTGIICLRSTVNACSCVKRYDNESSSLSVYQLQHFTPCCLLSKPSCRKGEREASARRRPGTELQSQTKVHDDIFSGGSCQGWQLCCREWSHNGTETFQAAQSTTIH